MSGLFGRVVNVDDGYVGTLTVGAIVLSPSASNPIPGGSSGIYLNEGTLTVSDPDNGESVIIIEETLNLTLDGYVDDITFQETKTAQNEINHQILVALDGYTTTASTGVSEITFQENKNAQEQINQSIRQSLDGYLTASSDKLVLNIAETSNIEVNYISLNRVSEIITWTDSNRTTKIREELITYDGLKVKEKIIIQYDMSGIEVERITETPIYEGFNIREIIRTLV